MAHSRSYLVQVDGEISTGACEQLSKGITIKLDALKYQTRPAKAKIASPPIELPERFPPVRFRKSIPTSWLKLEITEGKNRQVRKMTAAVGFPTLRLIRIAIGNWELEFWEPGKVEELNQRDFYKKLGIV